MKLSTEEGVVSANGSTSQTKPLPDGTSTLESYNPSPSVLCAFPSKRIETLPLFTSLKNDELTSSSTTTPFKQVEMDSVRNDIEENATKRRGESAASGWKSPSFATADLSLEGMKGITGTSSPSLDPSTEASLKGKSLGEQLLGRTSKKVSISVSLGRAVSKGGPLKPVASAWNSSIVTTTSEKKNTEAPKINTFSSKRIGEDNKEAFPDLLQAAEQVKIEAQKEKERQKKVKEARKESVNDLPRRVLDLHKLFEFEHDGPSTSKAYRGGLEMEYEEDERCNRLGSDGLRYGYTSDHDKLVEGDGSGSLRMCESLLMAAFSGLIPFLEMGMMDPPPPSPTYEPSPASTMLLSSKEDIPSHSWQPSTDHLLPNPSVSIPAEPLLLKPSIMDEDARRLREQSRFRVEERRREEEQRLREQKERALKKLQELDERGHASVRYTQTFDGVQEVSNIIEASLSISGEDLGPAPLTASNFPSLVSSALPEGKFSNAYAGPAIPEENVVITENYSSRTGGFFEGEPASPSNLPTTECSHPLLSPSFRTFKTRAPENEGFLCPLASKASPAALEGGKKEQLGAFHEKGSLAYAMGERQATNGARIRPLSEVPLPPLGPHAPRLDPLPPLTMNVVETTVSGRDSRVALTHHKTLSPLPPPPPPPAFAPPPPPPSFPPPPPSPPPPPTPSPPALPGHTDPSLTSLSWRGGSTEGTNQGDAAMKRVERHRTDDLGIHSLSTLPPLTRNEEHDVGSPTPSSPPSALEEGEKPFVERRKYKFGAFMSKFMQERQQDDKAREQLLLHAVPSPTSPHELPNVSPSFSPGDGLSSPVEGEAFKREGPSLVSESSTTPASFPFLSTSPSLPLDASFPLTVPSGRTSSPPSRTFWREDVSGSGGYREKRKARSTAPAISKEEGFLREGGEKSFLREGEMSTTMAVEGGTKDSTPSSLLTLSTGSTFPLPNDSVLAAASISTVPSWRSAPQEETSRGRRNGKFVETQCEPVGGGATVEMAKKPWSKGRCFPIAARGTTTLEPPLKEKIEGGDLTVLEARLGDPSFDPHAMASFLIDFLCLAIDRDTFAFFKCLLNVCTPSILNKPTAHGRLPLMVAVRKQQAMMVEALLAREASPYAIDATGMSCFQAAFASNQPVLIDHFLAALSFPTNLLAVDAQGRGSLYYLCYHKGLPAVASHILLLLNLKDAVVVFQHCWHTCSLLDAEALPGVCLSDVRTCMLETLASRMALKQLRSLILESLQDPPVAWEVCILQAFEVLEEKRGMSCSRTLTPLGEPPSRVTTGFTPSSFAPSLKKKKKEEDAPTLSTSLKDLPAALFPSRLDDFMGDKGHPVTFPTSSLGTGKRLTTSITKEGDVSTDLEWRGEAMEATGPKSVSGLVSFRSLLGARTSPTSKVTSTVTAVVVTSSTQSTQDMSVSGSTSELPSVSPQREMEGVFRGGHVSPCPTQDPSTSPSAGTALLYTHSPVRSEDSMFLQGGRMSVEKPSTFPKNGVTSGKTTLSSASSSTEMPFALIEESSHPGAKDAAAAVPMRGWALSVLPSTTTASLPSLAFPLNEPSSTATLMQGIASGRSEARTVTESLPMESANASPLSSKKGNALPLEAPVTKDVSGVSKATAFPSSTDASPFSGAPKERPSRRKANTVGGVGTSMAMPDKGRHRRGDTPAQVANGRDLKSLNYANSSKWNEGTAALSPWEASFSTDAASSMTGKGPHRATTPRNDPLLRGDAAVAGKAETVRPEGREKFPRDFRSGSEESVGVLPASETVEGVPSLPLSTKPSSRWTRGRKEAAVVTAVVMEEGPGYESEPPRKVSEKERLTRPSSRLKEPLAFTSEAEGRGGGSMRHELDSRETGPVFSKTGDSSGYASKSKERPPPSRSFKNTHVSDGSSFPEAKGKNVFVPVEASGGFRRGGGMRGGPREAEGFSSLYRKQGLAQGGGTGRHAAPPPTTKRPPHPPSRGREEGRTAAFESSSPFPPLVPSKEGMTPTTLTTTVGYGGKPSKAQRSKMSGSPATLSLGDGASRENGEEGGFSSPREKETAGDMPLASQEGGVEPEGATRFVQASRLGEALERRKGSSMENRRERRTPTGGTSSKLHTEWLLETGASTTRGHFSQGGGTLSLPGFMDTKGNLAATSSSSAVVGGPSGPETPSRFVGTKGEKGFGSGRREIVDEAPAAAMDETLPAAPEVFSHTRSGLPSRVEKGARRTPAGFKHRRHPSRDPPAGEGTLRREDVSGKELKKGGNAPMPALSVHSAEATFSPFSFGEAVAHATEGMAVGGELRSVPTLGATPATALPAAPVAGGPTSLPLSSHQVHIPPSTLFPSSSHVLNPASTQFEGHVATPLNPPATPLNPTAFPSTHTPAMWFSMATALQGGSGGATLSHLNARRPPTEYAVYGDATSVSFSTEFPVHKQPSKPAGLQHTGGTRHVYNHSKLALNTPTTAMEHVDTQLTMTGSTNTSSHYSLWSGFTNTAAPVTPDILAIWSREESTHGVDTRAAAHPYYSNASRLSQKGFSMPPTDPHTYTTPPPPLKGGEGANLSTFGPSTLPPNTLPALQLQPLNYNGGPSVGVLPTANVLSEYPGHALFSSHTPSSHVASPPSLPPGQLTRTYGAPLPPPRSIGAARGARSLVGPAGIMRISPVMP